VGALVVVVAEVVGQVAPEGGVAGHQRAREGGPPTLLQDRALSPLDYAVGLWSPGPDEAVFGTEVGHSVPEVEGPELLTVVCGDSSQLPTGR